MSSVLLICHEFELRSNYSCRSNIPAKDLTTDRCHITSQNHGYAIDASTLPNDWKEYFINLNDQSNEGNSPLLFRFLALRM